MLLAERRQDAAMAAAALSQINKAVETMRNSGNAPSAAFYEQNFPGHAPSSLGCAGGETHIMTREARRIKIRSGQQKFSALLKMLRAGLARTRMKCLAGACSLVPIRAIE